MFCNKPLGANEIVESFPVGRRLAFDAARGRLWVVCAKCERWNLTPLEERWEAVEDCERIFRDTRIRVSTENIGLARHREGLTLVRIGEPLRPEFAAWRYGDQFGRRRRRKIIYGAGAAVVLGGFVAGGVAAARVYLRVGRMFSSGTAQRKHSAIASLQQKTNIVVTPSSPHPSEKRTRCRKLHHHRPFRLRPERASTHFSSR